jgi:aminoglycoside phosphotransferase (APT) family kinase protein
MEIGKIVHPFRLFGEIVAAPPLIAESWPLFVLARIRADLERSRQRVSTIDRPHRAIDRMERILARRPVAEPRLVHGDPYPANVMVDAQGCVVGVVDFSGLTLSGDRRLDAADSVLHLTGLDGIAVSDQQFVRDHLGKRGLTDDDLALYRVFYAFRFLDTSRAGLLRWCLATIQAAC